MNLAIRTRESGSGRPALPPCARRIVCVNFRSDSAGRFGPAESRPHAGQRLPVDSASPRRRPAGVGIRRGRSDAQHQHGFTLLETLMAITLLALLLAGAYSGIQTSLRAMHSGERVIEQMDRMRTVEEFLRHQMSRIMPLSYAMTETGNYVFEGDRGYMRFVAPMPGYLSRGGPYVQTLALKPGTDGLKLVFSGAMLNGFDINAEKTAERDPVVLLDHIREGAFAYRALDEQGQLAPWSNEWNDFSVTPLMVQVQLVMQTGQRVDFPTLSVPLMLDSGATRIQPAIMPRLLPGLTTQPQPPRPPAAGGR